MELVIDFPRLAKVPPPFDVAGNVLVDESQDGLVEHAVCNYHLSLDSVFCAQDVSLKISNVGNISTLSSVIKHQKGFNF